MNTPVSRKGNFNPRANQGVALFISLVMLLILTVLGISSVQSTSMQERMARNARDSNLAFQAAESAIRDAEEFMESLDTLTAFTEANADANGYYQIAPAAADEDWRNVDWTLSATDTNKKFVSSQANSLGQSVTLVPGVKEQPKYIVEFIKTVVSDADRLNLDNIGQDTGSGRTQMMRATAYGTGGSSSAHVVIQSTYGKRF